MASTLLYVALSILLLSVLILVHEMGHFFVAKACGFPVNEFSIGMGPKLWQREKRGTKYTIRAIPMGGYVAFESMADAEAEERVFQKEPLWQRFLVLLAGPAMNVLLAVVIVSGLLMAVGVATIVPVVGSVIEGTPAKEAGLAPGDEFVSVNGIEIGHDYGQLQEALAGTGGSELDLVMERDGQIYQARLTPVYQQDEGKYQMGIFLDYEYVRYGPGKALVSGVADVKNMVLQLLDYLAGILFRGESTQDVTGVVGAVAVAAETGKEYGFSSVLYLFAFISVNLGVMNLLPLPALDGGKILLLGVELVRRKPLDPKYDGWLTVAGLAAFFLLFILITFRDVTRLVTGG